MNTDNYLFHMTESSDKEQFSIYIMRRDGLAMVKYFINRDRLKDGHIGGLNVYPEIRRQGEGLRLLEIAERMLMDRSCELCFLWTVSGSWMEAWYMRLGYVFHQWHEGEKNCVWLRKDLKL